MDNPAGQTLNYYILCPDCNRRLALVIWYTSGSVAYILGCDSQVSDIGLYSFHAICPGPNALKRKCGCVVYWNSSRHKAE